MFSRIRAFAYRHRRKFVVGGVLIGGAVFLSRYVQRAVREWQERETREMLERTRKQQHYESIERTCNQTALTLAPNLRDTVNKLLKTEELIAQLKNSTANKIGVWEKLKILSFTKISALVYSSSLLMVTLRIQLNLIGGYMFRDTIDEGAEAHVSSSLQEKYLCLCQFFVENGARRLCSLVEEKTKLVIQDRSLKEKLTLHDIEQIFFAIQSSISNDNRDPCKRLTDYIVPEDFFHDLPVSQRALLDTMILETKDLLESDEIVSLTNHCVNRGFSFVMDQIAEYFGAKETRVNNQSDFVPVPGTSSMPDMVLPMKDQNNFTNVTKVSIPMAKVIPIINGLVQSNSNRIDLPLTWMQHLILMDVIKLMGANVYEAFSNKG